MMYIYTEQARLYLRPGVTMTPRDVELLLDRLLDGRGSFWVPLWYDLSLPSHIDLQFGSGRSAGFRSVDAETLSKFEQIWVRITGPWADEDYISHWAPKPGDTTLDKYVQNRPCCYAFDEVSIVLRDNPREMWLPEGLTWEKTPGGFRASCAGSYLALNDRYDMAIGPDARLDCDKRTPGELETPTTACHETDSRISLNEVTGIDDFFYEGHEAIQRVDLLHAGRIVHRAEWGRLSDPSTEEHGWLHRAADHWDNCIDEEFLRLRVGAERKPKA